MPHVLFVCTANICRSPVAEGLLRQRLQARGLAGWQVSSAGTWAMQQRSASENSVIVMAAQGIDIRAHRAQMVSGELLAVVDLVLCMETGHAEALQVEFPDYANKIYLLTEMVGRHYSISDPYGAPLPAYKSMANEVADLIDRGLENIVVLAQQNALARPG